MALTDRECRNAKPADKQYRLSDGGWLTLLVKPTGTKLWQYRYRWAGKESVYSIGEYPQVGLADARTAMLAAKEQVKAGINPTHAKQAERLANQATGENTFKAIAEQWLAKKKVNWAESTYKQCVKVLEGDVFPKIGKMAIRDVKPTHILPLVKKVEERGAETLAVLILQWVGSIFTYAGAHLLVDSNPVSVLSGAVTKPKTVHRKPMTKADIARLSGELAVYKGNLETITAVKVLMLTFVRTGELRMAKWSEFDLDAARWTVPAERMKKREPHIVPLSTQVVSLLRQLHQLTGDNKEGYLFPNTRRPKGCMSSTTINRALEYMGFAGKEHEVNFSGHGFRATASTILNELGYRSVVIEMQLAHRERDKTRASYNQADYLPERVAMMQAWANLMDEYAKPQSNVVTLHASA